MEMEWISVDIWINHGYGYQWIPWIYDINMDSIGFIYIYMLYTYIYIYIYMDMIYQWIMDSYGPLPFRRSQ